MLIEVEIKKKDPELFREVARSVRAAVRKYGQDVEVKERTPVQVTAEEREVLLAVRSLREKGVRLDVFGILTLTGDATKTAVAIDGCKKKELIIEKGGLFELTEAGERELSELKEKLHRA